MAIVPSERGGAVINPLCEFEYPAQAISDFNNIKIKAYYE